MFGNIKLEAASRLRTTDKTEKRQYELEYYIQKSKQLPCKLYVC
jgi:hypothetical protein